MLEPLISRQFTGPGDLPAIGRFLSSVCTTLRPTYHWHLGNLLWSMYFSAEVDASRDLRLWQTEDGVVVGFAWFDEPNTVEIQLSPTPRYRGERDQVVEHMLAWGAERAEKCQANGSEKTLITWASEADSDQIAFLAEREFERKEFAMARMCRALDGDMPALAPAAGWDVRHVSGESELDRRVELHRQVWAPSRVTRAAYEYLRGAPGYRPELDLVLVAPDDTFAAYCICWFDPVSRSGVFEPVGTRPDLRGNGLGRIVMREGLRRLKALGATTAIVSTAAFNGRAVRLYEAVGFAEINRDYQYARKL